VPCLVSAYGSKFVAPQKPAHPVEERDPSFALNAMLKWIPTCVGMSGSEDKFFSKPRSFPRKRESSLNRNVRALRALYLLDTRSGPDMSGR